ncbi:hypothetical protein DFA_05844 [Cavenderia fasciculata]|uniref:Uncharacterized protein n=1 Tax=Cavenderia fasciculata TaxID=261658 RepID=F4PMW6_CACFS|nr:uncharacterized protein DFA_05844 [Cavenderia fasciculata]EGG23710.1 hypothetical protein DFA_05844 [Cavenderia fasciculata]|eukprot:XP_004361561.1 hypothetical protein DFA_05844 [Cavenderia fasciculata]
MNRLNYFLSVYIISAIILFRGENNGYLFNFCQLNNNNNHNNNNHINNQNVGERIKNLNLMDSMSISYQHLIESKVPVNDDFYSTLLPPEGNEICHKPSNNSGMYIDDFIKEAVWMSRTNPDLIGNQNNVENLDIIAQTCAGAIAQRLCTLAFRLHDNPHQIAMDYCDPMFQESSCQSSFYPVTFQSYPLIPISIKECKKETSQISQSQTLDFQMLDIFQGSHTFTFKSQKPQTPIISEVVFNNQGDKAIPVVTALIVVFFMVAPIGFSIFTWL